MPRRTVLTAAGAVLLVALAWGPARSGMASPPPAPAAAARQALDEEAAALMVRPHAIAPRDWHLLKWIYEGDGAVGRLHDLCTGAVEPKPTLSLGAWEWESLDPRTLSATERQAVLHWRAQRMAAGYGCGTVFQIGSLGSDARKAAGKCPADTFVDGVFADYVTRRPHLRRSNDLLEVATQALQEAGCR